jgi:hypothetical protein
MGEAQSDLSPGFGHGRHFGVLQQYHELSDRSYAEDAIGMKLLLNQAGSDHCFRFYLYVLLELTLIALNSCLAYRERIRKCAPFGRVIMTEVAAKDLRRVIL